MQSNCIIWPGAKNNAGYPVTWYNNKTMYKHRLLMNAGPNDVVLHLCDNPSCVNPEHLKLGTHAENSQNMVDKNRQCKGEDSHLSKLTEEIVLQIRAATGSLRKIAKQFNISHVHVGDIRRRKVWKHV